MITRDKMTEEQINQLNLLAKKYNKIINEKPIYHDINEPIKRKDKCPICQKNLELFTDHDELNGLYCIIVQCPDQCFDIQEPIDNRDLWLYITYGQDSGIQFECEND
jgi:hypothetical protein